MEAKHSLTCPDQALHLLDAELDKVTCFHSFETVPHRRAAIAYRLLKKDETYKNLVIVYDMASGDP